MRFEGLFLLTAADGNSFCVFKDSCSCNNRDSYAETVERFEILFPVPLLPNNLAKSSSSSSSSLLHFFPRFPLVILPELGIADVSYESEDQDVAGKI